MRSSPTCPPALLSEAARCASAFAATCMMMAGAAQTATAQTPTASGRVAVSGHVAPRCWVPAGSADQILAAANSGLSPAGVRCNSTLQVRVARQALSAKQQKIQPEGPGDGPPREALSITISPTA